MEEAIQKSDEKSNRNRSSNFTSNEKSFLFNIIAKYKNIIENKKTDAVTNKEKGKIWDRISNEFNAAAPGNLNRSKEVLKRFYENKKKELRKKVADEKIEIKSTGGGPPAPHRGETTDDFLLSIINKKTIYGLKSQYGGDVDSDTEDEEEIASLNNRNDVEVVYEFTGSTCQLPNAKTNLVSFDLKTLDNERECSDHIKINYTEENRNQDINHSVEATETSSTLDNRPKNNVWQKYKPADLKQSVSTPLKRKNGFSNQEGLQEGAKVKNDTPRSSRRRPAVTVKALTSSDVALKYNKLLDVRLEITNYAKQKMEHELRQSALKHEKEMALLDLKIEVEREKLKKIERSVDY